MIDSKLKKILELNDIHPDQEVTKHDLEIALLEIAQNQAESEDALVELANMIGG